MWRRLWCKAALNAADAPRLICESAGIGRQARLRGVCQPTCEFKSHLSHQKARFLSVTKGGFRLCVLPCLSGNKLYERVYFGLRHAAVEEIFFRVLCVVGIFKLPDILGPVEI